MGRNAEPARRFGALASSVSRTPRMYFTSPATALTSAATASIRLPMSAATASIRLPSSACASALRFLYLFAG